MTPLTQKQTQSVIKAIIYAFSAGFSGSLVLQASDVIKAVHSGRGALAQLLISVLVGAVIAGINGVAFAVEKLFTKEG